MLAPFHLSLTKLLHLVGPCECYDNEAPGILYANWEVTIHRQYIVPVSFALLPIRLTCSIAHQTYFLKHKFKDKSIKNFKVVMVGY
jgi:hypothetical protein